MAKIVKLNRNYHSWEDCFNALSKHDEVTIYFDAKSDYKPYMKIKAFRSEVPEEYFPLQYRTQMNPPEEWSKGSNAKGEIFRCLKTLLLGVDMAVEELTGDNQ